MIQNIIAVPRKAIESLAHKSLTQQQEVRADIGPFAVISITEPNEKLVKIPEVAEASLRLQFHDVSDAEAEAWGLEQMTDEDADDIVRFITQMNGSGKVLTIVVHCQAGISRSTGTAIAIARGLGLGEMERILRNKHPHFNNDVRRRVEAAFERSEP